MDNNLTNKGKFFAQYWGQDVLTLGGAKCDNESQNWGEDLIFKTQFLELTPLSQITDEDAIEVAKIWGSIEPSVNVGKKVINRVTIMMVRVADYLRSKGYAVDYLDCKVEQQIEYGWVKLKEA